MNLYEFSHVNNNEMGIYIERDKDSQLYMEAYQEAQRLICVSEEIKISVETIAPTHANDDKLEDLNAAKDDAGKLLSTTQLSKQLSIASKNLFQL